MENDISDIINKFNNILKDKKIDINNVLNNTETNNSTNENENKNFNLDITTLLKFKSIFDKANNTNNPRNKLLSSLKPFLQDEKKEKLDQYIKIANILYVVNSLNELNTGNN